MRKILVLRGGALGDFIVTLPALALLRRQWPAAQIELVGNASAAALGISEELIDAVYSQHEARWAALFGPNPLPPAFAAWLADFDLVLNFWPDPDGELCARFPLHARQTFLSASSTPTRSPAAAHYCEPLRALGLSMADNWYRLNRVALHVGAGTTPIAVHPGSGSPRKNWPMERWRELIAQLPAPVLVILGEAELERWGPLSAAGLGSQVRPAINLPLHDLVAQLAACRLFLGHDSGVSHLAAACGLPSVLLFGPSDPAIWAPPAPHVHVLRREPDLNSIPVSQVRQAVAAALADRT